MTLINILFLFTNAPQTTLSEKRPNLVRHVLKVSDKKCK